MDGRIAQRQQPGSQALDAVGHTGRDVGVQVQALLLAPHDLGIGGIDATQDMARAQG
jgi:hypothetical protein